MIIFGGKLIDRLLGRIESLEADNKLLTEALLRQEGKPLIFRPPETIPSPGWFDGKPVVTLTTGKRS